ncbi:hypothetical protein LUZ60_005202 [Juncus effusus]|nr:hypothetical protein LUZ60_005202 [Juncus effusus]
MPEIQNRALGLGIDPSSLDFDSIILPPGEEDFGNDDEILHEEGLPEYETGFGNVIIVDNLPVTEKHEKLEKVVRKIFKQIGAIRDGGLWIPLDPSTQETLGYCFIEYNTPQEAEMAKEKTNRYKFDRLHTFTVNMFDEFYKYMNVPDEWTPSEIKPYEENLQEWLTDEKARDQFVIRAGTSTEVFWNDARQLLSDPVFPSPNWKDSIVQWSPLGTYLATVQKQGAVVWGGASKFISLMRFVQPQVKQIDFSPGEKYLVTCSIHDTHRVVLNIFDMRTWKLMRDFRGNGGDFCGVSWPIFKWGGEKYFARIGKNVISVYETDTFTLLDKKLMRVDNVADFCWSPTDPVFAVFVPELTNQPARVSLVQIPEKVELRQKNLFSVSNCKMYWQSHGEYLAVKVDRYTKTKKSTYAGYELFRIKERDIPIQVLELDDKNDKIIDFAWEPKGHRFAVIHGDNNISFYSMRTAGGSGWVSKLASIKSKQANTLHWSPAGRFIVLAGLKGFDGQLEFYDVDELAIMATGEHFMATDVEWDPMGRYVATSVTSVREMENGFCIWSFNGKLLYRVPKDQLIQFLWRPRPPSLLTQEQEDEIARELKKYSKKYEAEDQDMFMRLNEQDRKKRRELREEWESWVLRWKRVHEEEREVRDLSRGGDVSDDEVYEAIEVEAEEVLDVCEEVVE